jgi:alkylhydroperoxidase/carboxymuconolactone decarboxylase family protein YurZ
MPESPLTSIESLDPDLVARIKEMDAIVYADGALPGKVKLLMALAMDAAAGAEKGVRALTGRALAAGATKAEIAETLRVVFQIAGPGAIYAAGHALKDAL